MTAAQQAPPPKPFPFQPVQWDGDEPYLEVEPDVRLTPFRDGDQDAQWLVSSRRLGSVKEDTDW